MPPVPGVIPAGDRLHRWGLGFRQSSLGHIARVLRHPALDASRRPPLPWHAAFPLGFHLKVGQATHGPPSESIPAAPGIQQGASRRTHDPIRGHAEPSSRAGTLGETSSTGGSASSPVMSAYVRAPPWTPCYRPSAGFSVTEKTSLRSLESCGSCAAHIAPGDGGRGITILAAAGLSHGLATERQSAVLFATGRIQAREQDPGNPRASPAPGGGTRAPGPSGRIRGFGPAY